MKPERTRLWLLSSLLFDPLLQGCVGGGDTSSHNDRDESSSSEIQDPVNSTWYYWARSQTDDQIYRTINGKQAKPELIPAYIPSNITNGDFVVEHNISASRNGQIFSVDKSAKYENKFAIGICKLPIKKSQQEFTHLFVLGGSAQKVSLSNDGRFLAIGSNSDRNFGPLDYFEKVFVYDLQNISSDNHKPDPILIIDSTAPSDPNKCAAFGWLPDNRLLTFNIGERAIYVNSMSAEVTRLGSLPETYGEYDVSHFTDISFDGKYLLGQLNGPENIGKYGTGYNMDTWVSNVDGSDFHQATYLQISRLPRWTPDNRIMSYYTPENPEAIHTGIRVSSFVFLAPANIRMLTKEQAYELRYEQEPTAVDTFYATITR